MKYALLSLVSGLMVALTLPTAWGGVLLPDMVFLAWIGIVPFYLVLHTSLVGARSPRPQSTASTGGETPPLQKTNPFCYGALFGAAYFGLGLYFAFHSLHDYAQLGLWVSLGLSTLFVAILALLFGVMAAVAVFIARRSFISLWFSLPLAWVALEFLRNYFPFGGIPWGNLAYSQRDFQLLLQILDFTGLYGILFILILENAVLAELLLWLRKRGTFPRVALLTGLLLFLAALGYGKFRLVQSAKQMELQERMSIALVQANIGQREEWDRAAIEAAIQQHRALTDPYGDGDLDLIIWPESPHPAAVTPETRSISKLKDMPAPLLLGILSYEGHKPDTWPPPESDENSDFILYNSAVIVSPSGQIFGEYRKQHLVPFGEYVPLPWLLRDVKPIVPVGGNFTAASEPNLLLLPIRHSPNLQKLGVLICFEDLFPELARRMVQDGATLLVNISNDGWYADTSVPYQHIDFSRFRAVENRRAVARATNTGITAFISPTGAINNIAPMQQPTTLVANVPVGGPITFYTRFGDVFAWGCIGLLIFLFGHAIIRRP